MLTELLVSTVEPAIINKALQSIIKSAISNGISKLKSITPHVIDLFSYRFESYVEAQYERHKYLNTLVFNNQKKLLEDIYIPLTLKCSLSIDNKRDIEIKIKNFSMDFLPKYNRVLITDTAGMGKSTLLRFLMLECIKSEYAIPIFIELRNLSEKLTITDIIFNQLTLVSESNNQKTEPELSVKYIEKILKSGDFVFFLDGYDEISFKEREIVTASINNFISKNSKNIFVISSRPETGLAAFPGFHRFNIKGLSTEESFELIARYDSNGEKSKQLITNLTHNPDKNINEYLKNPLLTSLLYRCYEYKQSLPLKKHIFYRQVYDALYDWHDATKDGYNTREKKSKLDIDSFHKVLRVVGFSSVIEGEYEFDTDKILSWIKQSKSVFKNLSFSESDFLEDSVKAVPVMIKDGNLYSWSHKSLAEYFGAQYICSSEGKNFQEPIFRSMYLGGDISRFSNFLDQIYDIDYPAFERNFKKPLVEDFKSYWETSYKGLNANIPASSIALRKALTFGNKFCIRKYRNFSYNPPSITKIEADAKNFIPDNFRLEAMTLRLVDKNSPQSSSKSGMKPVTVFVKFGGKHSTIINIMASKKDPFIKAKSASKTNKKNITHIPGKSFSLIDDDALSVFNSINNFDAVTSLMENFAAVLDYEVILNYDETDRERNLENMAKSWLGFLNAT